jgi:hypothetical protein
MAIRSLALPIWLRHSRAGPFSLSEIAAVHLPFGLRIERDPISPRHPLSLWAQTARNLGSITQAEVALIAFDQTPRCQPGGADLALWLIGSRQTV